MVIQDVYGECRIIKHPGATAIENVRQNQELTDTNGYYALIYYLKLVKQEWVKTDSPGRIITANAALNPFLDSLRITGDWLFDFGRADEKKGKELHNYQ